MTRLAFYARTALNHLRRGGQRIVVAVLCVAFGVMSLVAMTLISSALQKMLVQTPQDLIGADISLGRPEDTILPEHIQGLDALRSDGTLKTYTLVAYTSSLTFHRPGSGELYFPSAGIGIDPAAYPPIGVLMLENANNAAGPSTLLEEVGDVLVSRDLALEYHLAVGDPLILSDLNTGAPLQARIRGIISDTPNHEGSKLYYSLATAARLAGSNDSKNGKYLNTVLATASNPASAGKKLEALGWQVYLAEDLAKIDEHAQNLMAGLLNGAGVLGLLVSGVGTANTMQVLLRRRQREVAVWKSMGYQSGDLLVLFSLEAFLMGLGGSLLGAGLGVAISAGLMNLFSRTTTMLVHWTMTPEPVLLSMLVGVATTVVFALWAIVTASRVRPVALLRGETASAAQLPWFLSLLLLAILAVPFIALISLIMGSLLKAVGVLAAALIGLVTLGGGLGLLLMLVTRLLPLKGFPLLNMARGSLRRRGLAPVFALVALFVGVVALALASVVTQNAAQVMDQATQNVKGYNLTIFAPPAQTEAATQALSQAQARRDVESWSAGYITRVRGIHLATNAQETLSPTLIARSDPAGYSVTGADWGSRPDGVYVPAYSGVKVGDTLEVVAWDGSTHPLPVVGSYYLDRAQLGSFETGILLPTALSQSIAPFDQAQFLAYAPADRLTATVSELGAALPETTIINLVAYAARFTSQYHNLFVFAVSMASLALLAGALLMANSVSLSVLDRRYEIGVLKAMGYTRRQVLMTLMVEYALIALVATLAGLVVVRGFLWLVGFQDKLAASLLVLTPEAAGVITLIALALTMGAVLAVTWRPTQVSPLVVLNDRE